jgi:positive regulator of sigma E activity
MEEIAMVVGIFDNKLKLSFSRQESQGDSLRSFCEKCGACQKAEDGSFYLELENTVSANVGDKVLVKIESSNLKSSAVLYGLPSILFIIGIFVGFFIGHSEIFAFFTGFGFLVISFFFAKLILKKCEPKIEKII